MKVIGVSDVSLGYGSPEVPAIFDLACRVAGERGVLLEPDEDDRPLRPLSWDDRFECRRLGSDFPSRTTAWRRAFLDAARRLIDRESPETLVIFGGTNLILLPSLRMRPRRVIYHAYEQAADLSSDDLQAHRACLADIDLVIAPEARRLAHDCQLVGAWPKETALIYNSADVALPDPVGRLPADRRNGRFFWSGALHRTRTLADHLWSDELSEFEIDLYGRIADPEPETIEARISGAANLRRGGLVDAAEFNERRAAYAFSLVWWNPANSFGHLHLCSNRLFTSIAAGVPPVCGPHPQCETIVRRHHCGVVLEGWSRQEIREGLAAAMQIYRSPQYAEIVANCLAAAGGELGWPTQEALLIRAFERLTD